MILALGFLFAEIPDNFDKFNMLNTLNDSSLTLQDSVMYSQKNTVKYPGKAMIFSGIVPGLGELYNGDWKRALLFAGLEVASWSTWYYYNQQGDDQTLLFEQYADDHWSFKEWVTDYNSWDDVDSEYRILFEKIDTYGEISDTSYEAIFEGSHSMSFYYDGGWHSTTDEYFKENYDDFNLDSVVVDKDNAYYENIGKYNHFFAGWDDAWNTLSIDNNNQIYIGTECTYFYIKDADGNDITEHFQYNSTTGELTTDYEYSSIEVSYSSISIFDNDGYLVAKSPNKWKYRDMRKQANDFKIIAGYAVSAVLLNHVASMIDAVFVTRNSNRKREQNFSARLQYNPKNKYGISGLEVSFKW